jgi:hypothetical protein
MNPTLRRITKLTLIGLAACAIAALVAMIASVFNPGQVMFGDWHQFSSSELFHDEIVWAPLVFIVLTFAFFVAAVVVIGAMLFTVLVLAAVALLLLSPLLLIAGAVWLIRNGFDAPKSTAV